MFYIGQKIICIETISSQDGLHKIEKNSIHKIYNIVECCKIIFLDINYKDKRRCACPECYKIIYNSSLAHSESFRPLETFGDKIILEIEEKIKKEQEMFITI